MSTLLANSCETALADMPFLYVKYCPLKHGNVIYNTKQNSSIGTAGFQFLFLVNGTVPLSRLLDYRAVT